jgi:hypothetical protein
VGHADVQGRRPTSNERRKRNASQNQR